LMSKRRGCPSNRRKPEALRTKALSLIGERYWDFGPSLATGSDRPVRGGSRAQNGAALGVSIVPGLLGGASRLSEVPRRSA
jgi:hypothetical protein